MVFLGGHSAKYQPPTRVCVCAILCLCVLLCLVFIISAHLGNESNFLPVITADITVHSKFLQCHTDHLKSLRAGRRLCRFEKINLRNFTGVGGANP